MIGNFFKKLTEGDTTKLGGSKTPNTTDVLDDHGAPTTLQEGYWRANNSARGLIARFLFVGRSLGSLGVHFQNNSVHPPHPKTSISLIKF